MDIQQLERVFLNNYKNMVLYANEQLYDLPVAKDIVVDSYVSAYIKNRKFLTDSDLKAYIYISIRNRIKSCFISQKVKEKHKKQYLYITSELSEDESDFDIEFLLECVYAYIVKMPMVTGKKIFKMHYLEEKSTRQISEELGLSIYTVKNHLWNALKWLKVECANIILNEQSANVRTLNMGITAVTRNPTGCVSTLAPILKNKTMEKVRSDAEVERRNRIDEVALNIMKKLNAIKKEYEEKITINECLTLVLYMEGKSAKEISAELSIGEFHKYNLLKKTGHPNMVTLLVDFFRKGIVQ